MKREKKHTDSSDHYDPVLAAFLAKWTVKILLAVVIVVVMEKVGVSLRRLIKKQSQKENISRHRHLIIDQLGEASYYVAIVAGVIVALISMGVQTTSLLTITGTLLVAAGLALQNVLTTFASGISIAINEPFQVGDDVEICVYNSINRFIGQVKNFNIYFLTLRDKNTGSDVYVPNNIVSNNIVINRSRSSS